MCRTVTAPGVLYHNYRVINTPPPSQGGPYCMHEAGMQGAGRGGSGGSGRVQRLAVIGVGGVREGGAGGISAVQTSATTYSSALSTLWGKLGGCHRRFNTSILTIVLFKKNTAVTSPFPWEQEEQSQYWYWEAKRETLEEKKKVNTGKQYSQRNTATRARCRQKGATYQQSPIKYFHRIQNNNNNGKAAEQLKVFPEQLQDEARSCL